MFFGLWMSCNYVFQGVAGEKGERGDPGQMVCGCLIHWEIVCQG